MKSQVIFRAIILGSEPAGLYKRFSFAFHTATTTASTDAAPFRQRLPISDTSPRE